MDSNSLAQIVADPEKLDRLSDDDLVDALADLEGLRARVWVRLLGRSEIEGDEEAYVEPERDQMLNVEEASEIMGVTPRWLYDHSKDLPFTRKLAPRTLRFSECGLYQWLGKQ